jgi:hypothetical protein
MDRCHAATVSIKYSSVLWECECKKGNLLRFTFIKILSRVLWSTTTLNKLESHLNTPGQESQMFAGQQLQWL